MFLRGSLLLLLLTAGCAAKTESAETESAESSATEQAFAPPTLESPWGENDSARWRPEATLANAATSALAAAWSRENVRDAIVSVPVRVWSSDLYPYGDGQSNAVPSFEGFPGSGRAPIVATLVQFKNAPRKIHLRLDRALGNVSTIELRWSGNTAEVAGSRDAKGDLVADWSPPSSLTDDATIAIHPKGWNDWFAVSFVQRVVPAQTIGNGVRFSDGRSLVNRENITANDTPPFAKLSSHTFTTSYNGTANGHPTPFTPSDTHGRFPYFNRLLVTAVGTSSVWVADERPGGYKSLYGCFSGRNIASEANAPDGAVATGSGWHKIGDPMETIANTLEKGAILVGSAKASGIALLSGGFAWGLSDVATYRWLRPGEAFSTARGTYHAFHIAQKETACVELFTHPD